MGQKSPLKSAGSLKSGNLEKRRVPKNTNRLYLQKGHKKQLLEKGCNKKVLAQ